MRVLVFIPIETRNPVKETAILKRKSVSQHLLSLILVLALGFLSSNILQAQVSDQFVSTSDMNVPRVNHTATLLKDGKVLIAGGRVDDNFPCTKTATAEIYDPATGQFTMTGSLNVARVSHSAVLLDDGRVWIVGGYGCGGDYPLQTELYDPSSGTFSLGPNIPYPLGYSGHSCVSAVKLPDGTVLTFGGTPYSATNEVLKFDPVASTITVVGHTLSTTVGRGLAMVALLQTGEIAITGVNGSPSGELYNPTTNTSRPTANQISSLMGMNNFGSALLKDGRWVMVGGGLPLVIFDPTTESFTDTGDTQFGGTGPGVALLDGRALFLGSSVAPGAAIFDPASNALSLVQPNVIISGRTATRLTDGRVLITGGLTGNASIRSAELFVPSVNRLPVASIASVGTTILGQSTAFDGSASNDPDGSITRYSWNFGDATGDTGAIVSHIYAAAGTYTVTLTVTDNDGATVSAIITARVDAPPVAKITPIPTVILGQSQTFDGSASNDPDGSITSYSWNFGDGTNGAGAVISHTYSTPGEYTATLTVTDNDGATASVGATTVVSAPPGYTPSGTNVVVNLTGGVTLSFSDVTTAGITTLTSLTNGPPLPTGEFKLTPKTYFDLSTTAAVSGTITVCAPYTTTHSKLMHYVSNAWVDTGATINGNLLCGTVTSLSPFAIVEPNLPPVAVVSITSLQPAILGESAAFNGSSSHDPDGMVASYVWDFGDGSTGSGATASHTYAAAGSYTVTLTVTDNDGATGSATATAIVETPVQAINDLIGVVECMNLAHGIENSLDTKLQNAIASLNAANAAQRADAINKLYAFINAVQAQSGNKITVAEANQLIAAANRIIATL